MTSLADATAAPVQFAMGDKTLRLSPLTDADFGEYERYLQDRYVSVAKRNCTDMSEAIQIALMKEVIDTAAHITITSVKGQDLMTSMEAVVRFVWMHCRKYQPELTEATLFEWLSDDDVHKQIMDKIEFLHAEHSSGSVKKKRTRKKKIPTRRSRT